MVGYDCEIVSQDIAVLPYDVEYALLVEHPDAAFAVGYDGDGKYPFGAEHERGCKDFRGGQGVQGEFFAFFAYHPGIYAALAKHIQRPACAALHCNYVSLAVSRVSAGGIFEDSLYCLPVSSSEKRYVCNFTIHDAVLICCRTVSLKIQAAVTNVTDYALPYGYLCSRNGFSGKRKPGDKDKQKA